MLVGSGVVRALTASTVAPWTGAVARTAAESLALALTLTLPLTPAVAFLLALPLALARAGAVVRTVLARAAALANYARRSGWAALTAAASGSLLS